MVWRAVAVAIGLELPMSPTMLLPTALTKKNVINKNIIKEFKLNFSPFEPPAVRLDAIELTEPLLIDTEDW